MLDSGSSFFVGGYSEASDNPKLGALFVDAMGAMGYDAMALGQQDLKQVASIAHRMKGAAANCSMTAMANTAARIEQQARDEQAEQLLELLSDLDRQLDEFRLACERELTAGSSLR